jgi:hypothetical protein
VFIPAFAARAGSATPTSAAARASREANHQLTFALDQSLGADHDGPPLSSWRSREELAP